MSYKTILVGLNDADRAGEITDVACQLAGKFDAHLIGLFVIPAMPIYPEASAYISPDMVEAHEAAFVENSKDAKSLFEAKAGKYDLNPEWRVVHDSSSTVTNAVIGHGLQADLIVIGQVERGMSDGFESDFADRVVMESGRPVLLVPTAGNFETVGENTIVGWNATSQSARATLDALPILKSAKEVRLAWADPGKISDSADQLPGSEMATTLSRHGVVVMVDPLTTGDLSVAEALQARAVHHDADLIVAGAYGHSRMREYVFGGVTRELLRTMTVPVLMSH